MTAEQEDYIATHTKGINNDDGEQKSYDTVRLSRSVADKWRTELDNATSVKIERYCRDALTLWEHK